MTFSPLYIEKKTEPSGLFACFFVDECQNSRGLCEGEPFGEQVGQPSSLGEVRVLDLLQAYLTLIKMLMRKYCACLL